MDITVFSEAQQAYKAGDYARALQGFTACTPDLGQMPADEVSKLQHLIGNCYIKSGSPAKAAEHYALALEGAPAKRSTALRVNLGTALLSAKDYEGAIEAFKGALEDSEYATPYKAYSGIGAANLKLGDMTAAGAAYREAALDPSNPNPGKALVNLGVCFMELDRPADAAVSYETALDLGLSQAVANKARANLGCAYMATGRIADAIAAFGSAMADGTYELDEPARRDLAMARSMQQRFGDNLAVVSTASEEPADEQAEQEPADTSANSAVTKAFPAVNAPVAYPEPEVASEDQEEDAGSESDLDEDAPLPSPDETAFFDFDEAVAAEEEKEERKKVRKSKGKGTGLKVAIAIVIVLILLAGAAAVAYVRGYGYPTQETVTKQFFAAVETDAGKTDKFWAPEVSQADRESQMAALEGVTSCEVTAVQRSVSSSAVFVTATLEEGGQVFYRVVLDRDRASWNVRYVELYFPSENSGN